MKPRPVSKHAEPTYPTRREFLTASVAALATAGISGCTQDTKASALVAPVFSHGEGRGAVGCVVVSPPVFLSEEEALQVIREELSKIGVTLGKGMAMPDVILKCDDPLSGFGDGWLGDPLKTFPGMADLAAVDRKQQVGVVFVTGEHCDRLHGGFASLGYDTNDLAKNVSKALRKQAKQDLCVGVFYDPLELEEWGREEPGVEKPTIDWSVEELAEAQRDAWRAYYENIENAVKDRSRTHLRRQVSDFVAWMEKNR